MTNVLEAVVDALKTFVDEKPKPPLHVGEVMACWTYLALIQEAAIFLQGGLNTTIDAELRNTLLESKEQCEIQSKRLSEFMVMEGISLPPTSEEKPVSETGEIPLGVKLTDDEIANGVSIKTVAAITSCAAAISESIRTDVGLMFTHFLSEKLKYGSTLKTLMIKRGWIKIPPYYVPSGLPKKN